MTARRPRPHTEPMGDLAAIEARIWSILEPYRDRLEASTIYGVPSLTWPGAKAHDYFAAVKSGKRYVSIYLLVADTYPEAVEGASPALLKRRSGKATFSFPSLDDDMAAELDAVIARLFARYQAAHVVGTTPADRIGAVTELLVRAEEAHGVFEATELNGVYDQDWPRWYAAYAVEHGIAALVGHAVSSEELAQLLARSNVELERADPTPSQPWAAYTARRIIAEL